MIILLFGAGIVCFIFWALLKYFKDTNAFAISSDVVLTKGKVVKKFYSGGDPRISGLPTMKLQFTHDDVVHEIEKQVAKELFFEYDEGEDIELFVSVAKEVRVYPLKSIQEKPGHLT